jgi:uncharacterized protein
MARKTVARTSGGRRKKAVRRRLNRVHRASATSAACFSQAVVERIGFYVYLLKDPRDGAVFYIGKGAGNRVFAHAREALESPRATDKLERIREIVATGREVAYEIVRHGLTEKEAFEVESAVIDVLGLKDLANAVEGHHVMKRGRMTVAEIIAAYRAEPVEITEPTLLVIVNRNFERNISTERLYSITRGDWSLSAKRKDLVRYGVAVYKGLVRAAYRVESWEPAKAGWAHQKRRDRWRFSGPPAPEMAHLIGGSVAKYLDPPSQSPVRYVNC